MSIPLETIFHAACGDAQALADIVGASEHDVDSVDLLTAVVLTDPAPHPLAALAAPAMQDRSPQTLCAVARRALPAAAALLEQDACAALRAALAPHLSRVWDALADPSDRESIAACARLAPAMNAAALLEQDACADLRSKIIWRLSRAWNALAAPFDQESIAACARMEQATQRASVVSDLLERIGAEGWTLASPEARAALMRRNLRHRLHDASGI